MYFDRILTRVAQEYRRERWYTLLTSVLTTAIKSAYLLASVEDFIRLSLELMADEVTRSVETKTRVQVDILQVVCVSMVFYTRIFMVVVCSILSIYYDYWFPRVNCQNPNQDVMWQPWSPPPRNGRKRLKNFQTMIRSSLCRTTSVKYWVLVSYHIPAFVLKMRRSAA